MPRDGPKSWPSSLNKRQWLAFYRINGMALQGAGVIDGRGQNWWDLPCKPHQVIKYSLASTHFQINHNLKSERFDNVMCGLYKSYDYLKSKYLLCNIMIICSSRMSTKLNLLVHVKAPP